MKLARELGGNLREGKIIGGVKCHSRAEQEDESEIHEVGCLKNASTSAVYSDEDALNAV